MGGITGILVAFLLKGIIEADEEKANPWANEYADKRAYFSSDTFDMARDEKRVYAEWQAEQAWLEQNKGEDQSFH